MSDTAEPNKPDRGTVTVRAASPSDLPRVFLFLQPFMEAQQLLERSEEEVAGLLPSAFVAEQDRRVVGFAAVEMYSRKMAEIQCLAVSDDVRRQGIGRQLIQRCVERARELGVREVMAITSSESLFMSCGFHYSLPGQKKALFITP